MPGCPYCGAQMHLSALLKHAKECTVGRKNTLALERDARAATQPAEKNGDGRSCLCPCGEMVYSKRGTFLPGHDAKLKSLIAKDLAGEAPARGVTPEAWAYAKAKWCHLIPGLKDADV